MISVLNNYTNKQRLLFLISILLGCVILGAFCHVIQTNKQKMNESERYKIVDAAQIPKFFDYSIEDNLGEDLIKPVSVDFKSHSKAINYRTALVEAEKSGPNFNYKYTIADWSCGTECHSIAVIDSSNGRVYFPDIGYQAGISFNISSRLLVVNPPQDINEIYGNDPKKWPSWLTTTFFVWENNDFHLIKEARINFNVQDVTYIE